MGKSKKYTFIKSNILFFDESSLINNFNSKILNQRFNSSP